MTTTTINYLTFHLLFEFDWVRIKLFEEREYNPNYRTSLTVFKVIEFINVRKKKLTKIGGKQPKEIDT